MYLNARFLKKKCQIRKEKKMDCKNIHKAIVPYIENKLNIELKDEFEKHILECKECKDFLHEFQKTYSLIETEKIKETNPFFYAALKAKMENKATKQYGVTHIFLSKILQPAIFTIILIAGIYTGLKIGKNSYNISVQQKYDTKELSMYLNELNNEPIETFLMD